jgi:hypothetical protein
MDSGTLSQKTPNQTKPKIKPKQNNSPQRKYNISLQTKDEGLGDVGTRVILI